MSFNYDNRSGVLGAQGVQSGDASRTLQKLQWIREGAADRFDEVEIEIVMSHPHTLLGSVDYLCDELERRRDVYNISYVSIPEDQAVAFAPVVHRLADK